MTTLDSLKLRVEISQGPSREDLFDALRLMGEKRDLRFVFTVDDLSRQLIFVNPILRGYTHDAVVRLEGRIRGIDSADDSGENWRIRVSFLIHFFEMFSEGTTRARSYHDRVEMALDYNTVSRKGSPVDQADFINKCMLLNPTTDENNPGGLWFDDRLTTAR